eukprot:3631245-Pleurochrysis_carterae.AAC.1
MLKEKLWGKTGSGAGCMSSWDMERIVKEALTTLAGEAELAWHWAIYDSDAWAKSFDCVSKGFKHSSQMRYWEYEYDFNLIEHGFVRVTFCESVLPSDE